MQGLSISALGIVKHCDNAMHYMTKGDQKYFACAVCHSSWEARLINKYIEEQQAMERLKAARAAERHQGLQMKYFVLTPTKANEYGAASRAALKHYADIIEPENPQLADELRRWVYEIVNGERCNG